MKSEKIRTTITIEKDVYDEIVKRAGLVKISTWINNFLKEQLKGGKIKK